MSDLCLLSDVKTYLAKTDTNSDTLLSALITNASAFIESWCNRTFASQSYTETYNGSGGYRLFLGNAPVTAVASLSVDGYAVPAASTPISYGYAFDADVLYIRPGSSTGAPYVFNKGVQNVTVTYTAGYTVIPFDIAQACIELVASKYKATERIDVKSMGLGPNQSTSYNLADIQPSTKALMANYRRWNVRTSV